MLCVGGPMGDTFCKMRLYVDFYRILSNFPFWNVSINVHTKFYKTLHMAEELRPFLNFYICDLSLGPGNEK